MCLLAGMGSVLYISVYWRAWGLCYTYMFTDGPRFCVIHMFTGGHGVCAILICLLTVLGKV